MADKSLWDSFIPKAKVIGSFARHCKDHKKERAELIKFVEHMVEDLKEDEEDIDITERYQFRVRKLSVVPAPKTRDVEYTLNKNGHDEYCFVCEEPFPHFSKEDVYPCRVCTRAFHKKCVELLSDSECSQFDKETMDRRHTNSGWSCYKCVNLSHLLTDKETSTLFEIFDEIDTNGDSYISQEEFVNYKNKTVHMASTDSGKQQIVLQFKKIDTDKDGRINWWEFLSHESRLFLAKRPTDELLDMLTEKEIVHAKAVFSHMDDDGDGLVTHTKALTAYRNWYKRLDVTDSSTLNLHADVAAQMVMEHDKKNKGTVTWVEFLTGQALYIVCGRPNL
ncbi:PHD finger protein 24-like [Mytilus edulis]|uniref:PHD finger protein 24-like n=1 Tax=Mytilus edulis TaxID=6550 RepID=UPI0039F09C3C